MVFFHEDYAYSNIILVQNETSSNRIDHFHILSSQSAFGVVRQSSACDVINGERDVLKVLSYLFDLRWIFHDNRIVVRVQCLVIDHRRSDIGADVLDGKVVMFLYVS